MPITSNKPKGGEQIAGMYDLGETIGRGHFAVVKLAKHVFTGAKVAVKVIDKLKLDNVSRNHLFQEVNCMKLVQHPHVVRLYEVIDTETKLFLILEYGDGGDMYDYINKHNKGLSEEKAKTYFRQIVDAISYCHAMHVVHRDLKPENIVFFEQLGVVKLTDFGFSNIYVPGRHLETSCGSLAYSAPEILLGDSYDPPAIDVWSLGIILYMLVCGRPPFQEANDSETLTMIMDCKYPPPIYASESCQKLIARMLVREPKQRPKLNEICNDIWLNTVKIIPHTQVSRSMISENDHQEIIRKMVDGNLAPKEEILCAIEEDAYNSITATYYLLAERRLKRVFAQTVAASKSVDDTHKKTSSTIAPLALSPRSFDDALNHNEHNDSDNWVKTTYENNEKETGYTQSLLSPPDVFRRMTPGNGAAECGVLQKRCSLIYEEDSESDEVDCNETYPPVASHQRPLHLVRSSPQLILNEIDEDNVIVDEENKLKNLKTLANKKCYRQRKNITQRSNSSSDASDAEDQPDYKQRHHHHHHSEMGCKPPQKPLRKDSSDHSSDNDGPPTYRLSKGLRIADRDYSVLTGCSNKSNQEKKFDNTGGSKQESCMDRLRSIEEYDSKHYQVNEILDNHLLILKKKQYQDRKQFNNSNCLLAECIV